MEYITAEETARRWGVSVRRVQELCSQGILDGACRLGREWMVPADAVRPPDRRYKRQKEKEASEMDMLPRRSPFPLMTDLYKEPGTAEQLIKGYQKRTKACALIKAQLAYLQGDTETAHRMARDFLLYENCFEMAVSASGILSLCAMYQGDIFLWNESRNLMGNISCKNEQEQNQLDFWRAVVDSSLYDNRKFPEWFTRGNFDRLNGDEFPAARVYYLKYLLVSFQAAGIEKQNEKGNIRDYMGFLAMIAEPMISQTKKEKIVVAELYLHLICAIAYHDSGRDELAIPHVDEAIALALPDRLYSPLAEYRRALDFVMDDRLKRIDTTALKNVQRLNHQLMDGWIVLHNAVMNRQVTNELTTREHEVAKLAAQKLSNQEIANQLHLQVGTVKTTMNSIMRKTGVKNRQALIDFI